MASQPAVVIHCQSSSSATAVKPTAHESLFCAVFLAVDGRILESGWRVIARRSRSRCDADRLHLARQPPRASLLVVRTRVSKSASKRTTSSRGMGVMAGASRTCGRALPRRGGPPPVDHPRPWTVAEVADRSSLLLDRGAADAAAATTSTALPERFHASNELPALRSPDRPGLPGRRKGASRSRVWAHPCHDPCRDITKRTEP
jgi:hypothetical protein